MILKNILLTLINFFINSMTRLKELSINVNQFPYEVIVLKN
jgi:hypothetical protein